MAPSRQTADGLRVVDLTLPEGDVDALRALLGRHVRLTVERLVAFPSAAISEPRRRAWGAAVRAARAAVGQPARRRRLFQILRLVDISGPIHAASNALEDEATRGQAGARAEPALAPLLLELAAAGLLEGPPVAVPGTAQSIPWGGARFVLDFPADADGLLFSNGAVEVAGGAYDGGTLHLTAEAMRDPPAGVHVDSPSEPVTQATALCTFDNNPLSDFDAHPDKEGNAVDLSGRPAAEWAGALSAALRPVEGHLPLLATEMATIMQRWVPVGFDPERHLSASYKEVIGQAYLTLHPNAMTMTEAMIHEFQHNKVNALLALDPLLHNAFWPLYPSPVRPDPRPLNGVLLAVHAFLPVAELYFRLRDAGEERSLRPDATRRLRQIIDGNHDGMEVLRAHGRWTPVGEAFFAQLDGLDRRHRARLGELA